MLCQQVPVLQIQILLFGTFCNFFPVESTDAEITYTQGQPYLEYRYYLMPGSYTGHGEEWKETKPLLSILAEETDHTQVEI